MFPDRHIHSYLFVSFNMLFFSFFVLYLFIDCFNFIVCFYCFFLYKLLSLLLLGFFCLFLFLFSFVWRVGGAANIETVKTKKKKQYNKVI